MEMEMFVNTTIEEVQEQSRGLIRKHRMNDLNTLELSEELENLYSQVKRGVKWKP